MKENEEYRSSNERAELSEDELKQVVGGSVDWKHFASAFLDAFNSGKIQPTEATKDLTDAIKAKDWLSVAAKALSLSAAEPVIAMILFDCRT